MRRTNDQNPKKEKKPSPKKGVPLKAEKDKQTRMLSFWVTEDEAREITRMAQLYAGGDKSKWFRYAALHMRPGRVINHRAEVVA